MHRSTTRAARLVAATLTATVAFGLSAPVVNAAPDRGPGVVKVTKGKAADKQQAQAQRRLDRLVKRLDARLVRAIKETRVSRLAVIGGRDTKLAVIDNVRADRAAVAAAATLAQAKQYRPVKYVLVVNVLRQAAGVQTQSDALGGNAQVDALVASAVQKALAVTALSPRAEIKSARADLSAAKSIVAATVPAPGDETDDPVDGDEPDEPDEPDETDPLVP